jgi:small subunit ribosomal protein S11
MADVKDKAEEQAAVKPDGVPASAAAAGAGEQKADGAKAARPARVPKGRVVPFGVVHIRATFNNTMISITDSKGGVVAWNSAGRAAFKGSRKSTAFAGSVVAQEAARQAVVHGMQEVEVRVQGPGAGRESAIRALTAAGLTITMIKDVTPMPHNGCRARKRRRV